MTMHLFFVYPPQGGWLSADVQIEPLLDEHTAHRSESTTRSVSMLYSVAHVILQNQLMFTCTQWEKCLIFCHI